MAKVNESKLDLVELLMLGALQIYEDISEEREVED
jgi:hypothetical protein